MLRMATGASITIILLIFFITGLHDVTKEYKELKGMTQILDEKIPIETFQLKENSYLLDQNGKTFSMITGAEKRIYLKDEQIPKQVKEIFIAAEDQLFEKHIGFDVKGIVRAILKNAEENSIEQGGSTITQQLARGLYLTNEKTYNRKLSELLYSIQLERKLSKEKILELYINEIYFQHGIYGIEAASQYYFSQSANELSLAKLAFLCAIPNNPTYYDPLTYFEHTQNRQQWILKKLLEEKYINQSAYNEAINEKVSLHIKNEIDQYPDYVTYIHHELKRLISESEGFSKKIEAALPKDKEKYIEQLNNRYEEIIHSGIIIHTALNPSIQQSATKAFTQYLPYKGVQGSAVVIDNRSQQIVALTGGKYYQKFNFNRGYQAYRQPGSAIKPLLVYSPFINEHHASESTMINAGPFCKYGFCPQNYGGSIYGNVTLTTALKYSYNTAAVRLLDQVGIQTAFQYLDKFQFSKVSNVDQTLAAALGGFSHGVTPLELTNAYTTFAHDGYFKRAHGIKAVTNREGQLLYTWNEAETDVWSHQTNQVMKNMLAEVVLGGTAKKAFFPNSYIGGKTGTTNNFKDLWFIGLTDEYTAGVWVGKDTPASIEFLAQNSPQLLIWKKIMKNAH